MEDNAEIQSTSKKQEKKKQDPRTKKLHVCSIPKNATKHDLKKALSAYGDVTCKFINKDSPGIFSFVTFTNVEDAEKAVMASQKKEIILSGKKLVLSYYRTKRMNAKYKNEKKYKKNLLKKLQNKADEEEITGDAIIDILDDDCLSKIFTYLPIDKRLEIEDVCTRWKDVGEQQAWHDIKTLTFPKPSDEIQKTQKPYFNKLIKRCGRYLTTLKLNTYCSSFLLSVRKYCYNLQTLQVEFLQCSPRHFFNAFNHMDKLEQFEIKNIKNESSSDCLSSLPSTIQKIHMSMVQCDSIFGSKHKFLPRNTAATLSKFTALKSLTLNGYVFKKNVSKVLSQKQTIEYLNVASCEFHKNGLALLTNLVNLKYLNLEKVFETDDQFLINLSSKCQNIENLNVNHCIKLSDKGVSELAKLPKLEILLISNMTDDVTDAPFGRMKMLKTLECEYSLGIHDSGIIRLLKIAGNLSRLSLAGTSITNETIINAANITKKRQNNVKLNLCVDRSVINDYDKAENLSPLLIIEIRSSKYHDSDDDDDDDEEEDYDFWDDDDDDDDYYDDDSDNFDDDDEDYGGFYAIGLLGHQLGI